MKKQNIIPIIALLALVSMMIVPVMAAPGGLTYTSLPDGSNIYEGDVWNFVTWGCFNIWQYNAQNQDSVIHMVNRPRCRPIKIKEKS